MTFPDPEVLQELAKLALARLDVDAAANLDICRRLQGHDGVPTFVLLDEQGNELHRWVGALPAANFLAELRRGPADAAAAGRSALEHHAALATYYLERNDGERAAEQLRAMERLDPGRCSRAIEQALWSACAQAQKRRDWDTLRAAAARYLELPEPPRAEQARALLGIAGFESTGRMTPELQAYVDARIDILDTPTPRESMLARIGRLLGGEDAAHAAALSSWVERQNATMFELTDVGRAAAAALRQALLLRHEAASRAAVVLGWMRLPETTPWLCERLADPATPAWSRPFLVMSIAGHREPRCMDALIRCLDEREPAAVRAEAAAGVGQLLQQTDAPTRPEVAVALARALEADDRRLCANVLQALMNVRAPLPLERLFELLEDRRTLGWGDDYRIRDNALWVLLAQFGTNLERADGTPEGQHCSPDIATWLRAWYARERARLRWDTGAQCYRSSGG